MVFEDTNDEATVPNDWASPLLAFEEEEEKEEGAVPDSLARAEALKERGSQLFGAKDYVAASTEYRAALSVVRRMYPISSGSLILVAGSAGGLKGVGTVADRDADQRTVDVMYDGSEEDDDDLPMRRVVGVVAATPEGRRLQVTTYLNLARCAISAKARGRERDAVAACTLALGIADFDADLNEHRTTALILRARAHLAQSHLKQALRDAARAAEADPQNRNVQALQRDVERAKRTALKANKRLAKEVTTWVANAQEKYAEAGGDEASCNQQ